MSNKKLVTTNQRREIAQLLEDDQAFLDFVINETTNDSWLGDETCKKVMKILSAESEQEFFAGLGLNMRSRSNNLLYRTFQFYISKKEGPWCFYQSLSSPELSLIGIKPSSSRIVFSRNTFSNGFVILFYRRR